MARFAPVLILLALAACAVGCGYDEGQDLRPIVERAVPAGGKVVGRCGGSSGLIESPSYGCTYVVPGDASQIAADVASALAAQGFDVSCRASLETTIDVSGLRGDIRVHGEVTEEGSIIVSSGGEVVNVYAGGHTSPDADPIPAGSVALDLDASRQSDASAAFQRSWVRNGFPCTQAQVRAQTPEACVAAWNAPVNAARRELAVRRMRVPAAYVIVQESSPGVASGCFFGFLAQRGRYLMFESRWDGETLVFAEPELGYASGRGLDADARARSDGRLVLKAKTGNEQCAVWWNASAGWKLRRDADRRRLSGPLLAVYTDGSIARCTYVVRTRGGYYRASITFDAGDWTWKRFDRIPRPPRFRPNGELGHGWLSVAP